MLLLSFLATILMFAIANLVHTSGAEAIPISLLADFGTNILGPVKTFCEKHSKRKARKTTFFTMNSIFCESANTLDKQFKDFGKQIMKQLHMTELETDGHSIFAAIQTHIEQDRLVKPTLTARLNHDYRGFVIRVGKQIVGTMTGRLHRQLDIDKINRKKLNAEIGEIYENAETDKIKLLRELFLKKVKSLKIRQNRGLGTYTFDMYGLQLVATKISENCKGEDAEKKLKFFLALFVANLKYIEVVNYHNGLDTISDQWETQMTMDALSKN